jgi:uncharacterized membrane protein YccC
MNWSQYARAAIFSVNSYVAAMLALFLAFSINLERPFWAVTTVYITSQPLSGAVRSKAVYRLVGTVVGAVIAVALVPTFVTMPTLLSLLLAAWVGGCLFVSLLDRTPRSYLFMLSGYTAAIIGFSSVATPEAVFTIAIARTQEIGIGVLCAAVVHAVVFPISVTGVLARRVNAMMADMRAWMVDSIAEEDVPRLDRERERLVIDLSELHGLATHVPFDTGTLRPTRAMLAALQDRMVSLLPLISAIEDRRRSLIEKEALTDPARVLLADIRGWIARPEEDAQEVLAERCRVIQEQEPGDHWASLLRISLLARLRELLAVWRATHRLAAQMIAPDPVAAKALAPLLKERVTRPLHRDYGLALSSGLAAMVATFVCCLFWILTAWPDGAGAATMVAIICCVFAAMDDPVPAQQSFLIWTIVGVPLAAAYLFVVLPQNHDFVTFALAMAPMLLVIGALMTVPRWNGRMMPLVLTVPGSLSLDNRFSFDASRFLNGVVGLLVAVVMAIAATRLLRSITAGTAIHRIRKAGWRDLARLSRGTNDREAAAWRSRMLDRAGLVASRLNGAGEEDRGQALAVLGELRVGMNVMELERIGRARYDVAGLDLLRLRDDIAGHYLARIRQPDRAPDEMLRRDLDSAILLAMTLDGAALRQSLLAVLTGLRRNFFADAPAWRKPVAAS